MTNFPAPSLDELLVAALNAADPHSQQQALYHPDATLRRSLASALYAYDDERAISALATLSADSDLEVRRVATHALCISKTDSATLRQALLARLDEADESIWDDAVWGLARRGERGVIPALAKALERDLASEEALLAARELREPTLLPLLEAHAERPDAKESSAMWQDLLRLAIRASRPRDLAKEEAIKRLDAAASRHFEQVEGLFQSGNIDAAILQANMAIEVHPSHAPSLLLLSELQQAASHRKRDIAEYEELISQSPASSQSHVMYGLFLCHIGEHDAALWMARRALELDASSFNAHLLMAQVHDRRGEPVLAKEHIQRAIQVQPSIRDLIQRDPMLAKHLPTEG